MKADYTIHTGWGDHVEWNGVKWGNVNLDRDTLPVYGHMPRPPRKGDTLMGEFTKSWVKFEFVEVSYPGDPPDMFFGKVKAIEQEMKQE